MELDYDFANWVFERITAIQSIRNTTDKVIKLVRIIPTEEMFFGKEYWRIYIMIDDMEIYLSKWENRFPKTENNIPVEKDILEKAEFCYDYIGHTQKRYFSFSKMCFEEKEIRFHYKKLCCLLKSTLKGIKMVIEDFNDEDNLEFVYNKM